MCIAIRDAVKALQRHIYIVASRRQPSTTRHSTAAAAYPPYLVWPGPGEAEHQSSDQVHYISLAGRPPNQPSVWCAECACADSRLINYTKIIFSQWCFTSHTNVHLINVVHATKLRRDRIYPYQLMFLRRNRLFYK